MEPNVEKETEIEGLLVVSSGPSLLASLLVGPPSRIKSIAILQQHTASFVVVVVSFVVFVLSASFLLLSSGVEVFCGCWSTSRRLSKVIGSIRYCNRPATAGHRRTYAFNRAFTSVTKEAKAFSRKLFLEGRLSRVTAWTSAARLVVVVGLCTCCWVLLAGPLQRLAAFSSSCCSGSWRDRPGNVTFHPGTEHGEVLSVVSWLRNSEATNSTAMAVSALLASPLLRSPADTRRAAEEESRSFISKRVLVKMLRRGVTMVSRLVPPPAHSKAMWLSTTRTAGGGSAHFPFIC
jgi:hypothetical protein